MRRKFLMGAGLCLAALFMLRPAPVWPQEKGPEIIRGTSKVPPATGPGGDQAYRQGVKFLEAGDYDKAVKALQQSSAANPRSADAYYSLGLAYSARGNQDKAIKNLQTALHLKPNFPQAHISLGQINQQGIDLLREGHPNQAVALLKEAVTQDPRNAGAFNNLGVALAQQGSYTAPCPPCSGLWP